MTEADLTEKSITPIGSFLHYGEVTQDWIMLKGGITDCNKLLITWRKSFLPQVSRKTVEEKAYFEYEVGSGAFGSPPAAVANVLAKMKGSTAPAGFLYVTGSTAPAGDP
jgi:hypothetical protein